MKKILYAFNGILFLFILWTILSYFFSDIILPYPWQVFFNIFKILKTSEIYKNLLLTSIRSISGFIIALITGTIIGIITGLFRSIEKSLFIPTVLLQGAPPILWIIPLMLILGTDGASPVAVVFFVILPLVILNIQEGTKSINKDKWNTFRIYANSKKLIILELIIPHLTPYFKSIFILGIVLSFKSSLIGEWFGAKNGIGRNINEFFYSFDMINFYSISLIYLILIGIIAFITKKISAKVFRRKITQYKLDYTANSSIKIKDKTSNLSINNLSFKYGNKNILDKLNFNLSAPETIVLTGVSGCGKTTFAKLSVGLIKHFKGVIKKPDNPCIIFQDDIFLEHLDCFGNAMLPGRWKKYYDLENKTYNILKICGLSKFVKYFPSELSGGMKKRLTFARALVLDPDFIILDEPFTNLDKNSRIELWNLFFTVFHKKIPAIIITHYPEDLKNRDVTFYKLENGKIIKNN